MLTKKQFTQHFSENLKKYRQRKGMSQEDLADKAELYRTYVGHLENARYSPSAYVVYKIAEVLHVSADELFK